MNSHLYQSPVTPVHKEQFEREGYFVLENVVPTEHLQLLRDRAKFAMQKLDLEMEERGIDKLGINHKGSRYFISAFKSGDESLAEFLFSDLMAGITRVTLGDDVFLFYEQYVIKAAEKGGKFSWHQDSGYVGYPEHKPYLSCWVTLDDVDENNGTVYMLPYEQAGTRDYVAHRRDEESNDMVGYFGDKPGIPVIAPAGSIAIFSSTVFHRSGPNLTHKIRRIYLPQYSAEPLLRPGGTVLNMAIPFLKNGERVR